MRVPPVFVALVVALGVQTAFAKDVPEQEQPLDVKEVISMHSDPDTCGITDAEMVYKNSKGEVKDLKYKIWGNGCQGG